MGLPAGRQQDCPRSASLWLWLQKQFHWTVLVFCNIAVNCPLKAGILGKWKEGRGWWHRHWLPRSGNGRLLLQRKKQDDCPTGRDCRLYRQRGR